MNQKQKEIWMSREWAVQLLPPRLIQSHKGTYGTVLVAAGSPGMMGAAVFAAKAAYRSGAGMVRAWIVPEEKLVLNIMVPEAVLAFDDRKPSNENRPSIEKRSSEDKKMLDHQEPSADTGTVLTRLPASLQNVSVQSIVLGPGLGKDKSRWKAALTCFSEEIPLILDADGLNLMSEERIRRKNMIFTPHYGEAARLLHTNAEKIMKDPCGAAVEIAREYQAVVLLKGVPNRIAAPDGSLIGCRTGNSGMATAGSGDVLAGLLGGLCAQRARLDPSKQPDLQEMAALAAWLHGEAGNAAARKVGEYALMASDMLSCLCPDLLLRE